MKFVILIIIFAILLILLIKFVFAYFQKKQCENKSGVTFYSFLYKFCKLYVDRYTIACDTAIYASILSEFEQEKRRLQVD